MSEMGHPVVTLTDEEITRRLLELEDRFGMSSEDFLLSYNTGELDDRPDFIDWAGLLYVAQRVGVAVPARV